ncbi:MAG: TolC family protein [Cyanobacteriota bacterium]|nr:TolC family protein [Cyanobacteriota bacterium]
MRAASTLALVLSAAALGTPLAQAGPAPSHTLLRSLERFEQDVRRLDRTLPPASGPAAANPLSPAELQQLKAPPAAAIPGTTAAVAIQQRLTLSLPQALELAVRNSPALAEQAAAVRERQGLRRSVQGRFWPELALELGGSYSQLRTYNKVWTDNAGIYPPGSPFLVQPNGWNRIQSNLGLGAAGLGLNWELVSFERGAALAETSQELEAARRRYANGLRQLQLDVSLAYYGLQLAEQLRRVRQAVVDNDTVVRDEVQALKRSGLVPRLDLLRAEANLQQSRYRLEQADALRLSRQRQLSNLLNAPFNITLTAPEAGGLQPPWPLDLERTLIAGFRDNPQLLALQAARDALLRQADRRAAELLPSLRLFARGGLADALSSKPVIDLNGCCAATNIPQLNSQNSDWAAGLELRWRLFDAGVTSGAVSASRAAAERTEQALARERNTIRQRMETAFYDHRASLGQIVAARSAFSATREAFRDVRARYQLGLANYTDVSDTIRQLTQAMEGVAESVTLANVSYAQLLRELLPVPDQPTEAVSLPLVLPSTP